MTPQEILSKADALRRETEAERRAAVGRLRKDLQPEGERSVWPVLNVILRGSAGRKRLQTAHGKHVGVHLKYVLDEEIHRGVLDAGSVQFFSREVALLKRSWDRVVRAAKAELREDRTPTCHVDKKRSCAEVHGDAAHHGSATKQLRVDEEDSFKLVGEPGGAELPMARKTQVREEQHAQEGAKLSALQAALRQLKEKHASEMEQVKRVQKAHAEQLAQKDLANAELRAALQQLEEERVSEREQLKRAQEESARRIAIIEAKAQEQDVLTHIATMLALQAGERITTIEREDNRVDAGVKYHQACTFFGGGNKASINKIFRKLSRYSHRDKTAKLPEDTRQWRMRAREQLGCCLGTMRDEVFQKGKDLAAENRRRENEAKRSSSTGTTGQRAGSRPRSSHYDYDSLSDLE